MSKTNEKYMKKLKALYRGELSAVETYKQAMEKFESEPEIMRLQSFVNDHEEAVKFFESKIESMGDHTEHDSGAWGTTAKTVMGAAKFFGDTSTLKALEEGEEHGLSEYKELHNLDETPTELKREIEQKFIPKTQDHINSIRAMKKLQ